MAHQSHPTAAPQGPRIISQPIDSPFRRDVVDLATRYADIHQLPVTQVLQGEVWTLPPAPVLERTPVLREQAWDAPRRGKFEREPLGRGCHVRLLGWHRTLLLLCRQEAWPNKRPRPMPAGPGEKDVVVEFLAHDSFHGPAEAGHVVAVEFARRFDHALRLPQQSRKIKRCVEVRCILEASPSPWRFLAPTHALRTSSASLLRIVRSCRGLPANRLAAARPNASIRHRRPRGRECPLGRAQTRLRLFARRTRIRSAYAR